MSLATRLSDLATAIAGQFKTERTRNANTFVPLPGNGTTAGYAPVVQADGTVTYAAVTAASPIGYDTDGVPYLKS